MPARARQPCKTPGCDNLSQPGHSYCPDPCQARKRADSDRRRGSATQRGYGTQHRTQFRRGVLTRDRICVVCRMTAATVADHWPLSRKQLASLSMDTNDPAHGRGLCKPCHDRSTAQEQPGGWNAWRGHAD